MRTSEVLNLAADLIEQRGWGKGAGSWGHEDSEPLCLEGGIYAAMGADFVTTPRDEFTACPAYQAVMAHVGPARTTYRDLTGNETTELWIFNDTYGRTASEVIEVLRATAVIEAARESSWAEVSA